MSGISRRDFIRQALVATAGLSGLAGLGGCKMSAIDSRLTPRKWRLGMQGAKTMDATLSEEIAILGRLGYDYIELRDWKLETFLKERTMDDLHRLVKKAGVQPINVSAIEMGTLGPCPERDAMAGRFEWYFKMAKETGCRSAEFVHFAPVKEGLSRDQVKKLVVEDLKWISDLAAKHDVKAIYEFLGSKALPIYNIDDTMEVLEGAGRSNLGWIFDLYQFYVTDKNMEALRRSNVKTLELVHICDAKDLPYEKLAVPNSARALPGDGAVNTPEVMRTLAQIGYKGPFVIELYCEEYMNMDAEKFARIARGKSARVLDKYYQPYI